MAFRIALFTLPAAAVAALVLLLNALEADIGIAVASLGLVAVSTGAVMGCWADKLPELRARRHHRLAGVHHGD
jgi:energy-converting hydrogenase Eha subunit A